MLFEAKDLRTASQLIEGPGSNPMKAALNMKTRIALLLLFALSTSLLEVGARFVQVYLDDMFLLKLGATFKLFPANGASQVSRSRTLQEVSDRRDNKGTPRLH